MSAEVAEAIRQTRRTLAEKTWVPRVPRLAIEECCLMTAQPEAGLGSQGWKRIRETIGETGLGAWNDRQTDVGAVLGMTLQALIAELCKASA